MQHKFDFRSTFWFFVLGSILVLSPGICAQTADTTETSINSNAATCQVTIDSGIVQGILRSQSCVYLGIPYAAPPVGTPKKPADPGRWRPPAPVTPWPGVNSFVQFGNMCPQLLSDGVTAVGKEDCLNVNVFSPPHQGPLPVLFMIHGSGNQKSSNRAEAGSSLDGQYFAEHGPAVVVVTNYRLGALGWLAHAALDAESATGTSGNYGILDQIAALKWVQRNIAAFGGDPSRVTVTGHSAGAQDTGVLFASPLAQRLFASILIDGGGFAQFDSPTLADYEATVGAEVVTKLGCAKAAVIPACLRALPSATIVMKTLGPGGLFTDAYYRPNIDGVVLNDNALQTAKEGAHNHVPLIIGGGARETANPGAFIPLPPDPNSIPTDAAYQAVIYDRFGQTVGDQILALYPSVAYPTPRDALIAVSTDYRFLCPARQLARAVSNSQHEPVYRFVFTHAQSGPPLPADPLTGIPLATKQGAWHGEELQFIFHSFTSGAFGPFTPTADELTLSDQILAYWARFAATGDPNGGNAPPWFAYGKNADAQGALFNQSQGYAFFKDTATGDDKKDTFFQFDTPPFGLAEGAGFHAEVCETFWDVLVGDTNNGHSEGSIAGDIDEGAGNEAFITDADLDNDDQPPPPRN